MKRIIKEIVAAMALTLASTGAAFAHATFETPQAAQNSYYKAVVQIPHSLAHPTPGILVIAASDSHGQGAAAAAEIKAGDLVIAAPTIKATPPNAPVSGGYLAIRNDGQEADRLVAGSASFAGKVEIHEMVMDGDVMKMRPVDGGIEIPAGGSVELKPGGLHVMFMGLKEQMKPGEKRKATLVFEKAGEVELEFDVMQIQGGHGGHDAHGSHGKQGMNHQMPGDDAGTIEMLMKAQFETPESPLSVEPVVVSGDWAVAGWSQEGRGGRGLLKKGADGWYIHMCGGEGFKHAENLAKTGMPQETAMTIAAELAAAEEKLGSEAIARFDTFEGIVEVGPAGHGHGHGAHGTHGTQGG